MNDGVSIDPTSFNAPERPSLTAADVPALGDAVFNLTRELWVLTDRVMVLEAVLEAQGVAVSEAVESFEPDDDMAARMRERGTALVRSVMEPFTRD